MLIEKALSNEILSVNDASCFLSNLGKDADRTVSEAAHAVVHFLTDADIRRKDTEYDLLLRAGLEKYVKQLRQLE